MTTDRVREEFMHELHVQAGREDIDFYVTKAEAVDGPVLELGCGTGRVYLAMLEARIDADGLDLSGAALDVLRENADEEGLEPSVWQGNMTDFAVEREYGLVICPFNTFQRLLTHEGHRSTFECVYDALAPGGKFIFDVFVPSFEFICNEYEVWHEQPVDFRGEEYTHRNRARVVDEIRQDVLIEDEAIGPDGEELFSDSHRMTLLPKSEMELLVEHSPFDHHTVTGDFADRQLADGDRSQVWSLTKV
jgi:SAM-dependent methyltransferase